jgi:hypothetical protein
VAQGGQGYVDVPGLAVLGTASRVVVMVIDLTVLRATPTTPRIATLCRRLPTKCDAPIRSPASAPPHWPHGACAPHGVHIEQVDTSSRAPRCSGKTYRS